MTALDSLLVDLPRVSLVVGKGGVGKTTCAVALAALFAQRGERTLLVSTDPAAALSDVLGAPVSSAISGVDGQANLDARQLSAAELREAFLSQWRDTIGDIVDRGTYLDRGDVDGLVDAALPGGDEIFALLALAELLADPKSPYARVVVDTAPTGHTLRLLALPETFRALLSMLDLMQNKHRFMVRALTHRYRRDRADDFLDEMRARVEVLQTTFADGNALAAVVVTRAESLVVAGTQRYLERLRGLHVRVAALIVNAAGGDSVSLYTDASTARYWLPVADSPPMGISAVVAAVRTLTTSSPSQGARRGRPVPAPSTAVRPESLVRTLTIVGGKGGVGKSTVACALAIDATHDGTEPTLLVSTDPAPSIADAFGQVDAPWAQADLEAAIDDVPGLTVRQMDASAAFARARDEYQTRVDELFTSLVGSGIDIEPDRAILRDLLALAPPGVDELFALSTLGDALAEGRFAHIIVDPAPTGHLLRLLDMPALALDWTHRIMRLMLKYQDIVGLGDTAHDLLAFAKRTRALDVLLHDRVQCGLVIVALDEPLVRTETARLSSAVQERGIDVSAVIWNRVKDLARPLPATVPARQFLAEDVEPPPIGTAALREWSQSWRVASPDT